MDKISFFLPTRKGSERVINKNTRPFAGIEGGLVENKIKQILATKRIDEIIFSSIIVFSTEELAPNIFFSNQYVVQLPLD